MTDLTAINQQALTYVDMLDGPGFDWIIQQLIDDAVPHKGTLIYALSLYRSKRPELFTEDVIDLLLYLENHAASVWAQDEAGELLDAMERDKKEAAESKLASSSIIEK